MSKITENDVLAEIKGFLERAGWDVRRQNSGLFQAASGHKIRAGKPGMCDLCAIRPRGVDRVVEYLEVEVKAPGEKPSKLQREYIAKLLHYNISATWADSLALFKRWYFMEGFE